MVAKADPFGPFVGGITLPQEYGAKTNSRRKAAILLLSFIAALRGPALFIFPSG
jgi:hypothetical protein